MDSEHPAPQTLARLEEHIDTALQKAGIPTAAYAVVKNGEMILARGVGKTEWNRGDPVTPDTLFAIGSLTKSMTATAILQLREQGKIDLDAPVQSYLPWFAMADPEHAARVSVRHLLNQTSGLGNGAWRVALNDPSLCTSLERTVRALATVKPIDAPGRTWAYSNAGFAVAGMVIEAVSGMPYARYLDLHILKPARMTRSTLDAGQVESLGHSRPYQKRLGRITQVPLRMDDAFAPAGLALYSTARDMGRYMMAQMDGALLTASSAAEAWRGQAEPPLAGMGENYGLGWMISDCNGRKMVFHHGGTEGHSAAMCMLPEERLGVVLLAGFISTRPTDIAMDMVPILLGEQTTGSGGLPNFGKIMTGLSLALGGLGVGLLCGFAAAAFHGTEIASWITVVLALLTLFFWAVPGILRRSQASPFPVPMNVGGGGWGTDLAVGWSLFLAGLTAWALYAVVGSML